MNVRTLFCVFTLLFLCISAAYFQSPVAKGIADLNGGASRQTQSVVCSEARFKLAAELSVGTGTKDVAYADMDSDGYPDIVAIFQGPTSGLSIFRNLGSGEFADQIEYGFPQGSFPVERIYLRDLDGDGRPDIVISSTFDSSFAVYRNVSTGPGDFSLAPRQQFASGGLQARSFAFADFDGDGMPDLVAANQLSGAVGILRNQSLGSGGISFSPFQNITVPNGVLVVNTGDIDADSKPDILVGSTGRMTVLRNISSEIGHIAFEVAVSLNIQNSANAILATDLDLDGRLDVALTVSIGSRVTVFRNTSAGPGDISFATRQEFPGLDASWDISSADLDGDGKPDLAVINNNSNSIAVFRNTSSPGEITFTDREVEYGVGIRPYNMKTGDLNGDGRPDIITANLDGDGVSVLWNTGSGPGTLNFYGRKDYLNIRNAGVTGFAVADLDGDGQMEIVAAFSDVSNVFGFVVYLNNGHDQQFTRIAINTPGIKPTDVAAADLDGDGKADLIFQSANGLLVYQNTSTGAGSISFALRRSDPLPGFPNRVFVGDFDGDGRPDVLATYRTMFGGSPESAFLFRNTSSGHGSFSFASPIEVDLNASSTGIAIADFNMDGRLDIANARSGSSSLIRFNLNTGTGPGNLSFAVQDVTVSLGNDVNTAVAADLDGDGKPELITWGSGTFIQLQVLRNQSSNGTLDFAPATTMLNLFTLPLGAADLNGDGKLDLIGRRTFGSFPNARILKNSTEGGGVFSLEVAKIVALGGDSEILIVDLDNDGVLDLVSRRSGTRGNVSVVFGEQCILPSNAPFDFDGDGKTDVSVYRPGVGEWWSMRSSDGSHFGVQFGQSTDVITPADFTGDGKADFAFWRPSDGHWYVLRSEDFTFYAFPFGTAGDIPMLADYDGDGKADAAVFRPASGMWFVLRSGDGGVDFVQFGLPGDQPVAADYDGDGEADIAIYRPSLGQWWLRRSTEGVLGIQFGNADDKTVPGDYTGDGKADVAFWRPSDGHWYILRSEDFSFYAFPFGLSTDIPAPGDYDGDGKFDAAVFRPETGMWIVNRSTDGILFQQFGQQGDQPLPNAFVR